MALNHTPEIPVIRVKRCLISDKNAETLIFPRNNPWDLCIHSLTLSRIWLLNFVTFPYTYNQNWYSIKFYHEYQHCIYLNV